MDIQEAMKQRHSVRAYTDKRIEGEVLDKLQEVISECNEQGKLDIQLVIDDKSAFEGTLAKYGKFTNVQNHVALIGNTSPNLDMRCGYYGEHIVLQAQMLGLNTCWVGLSYSKKGSVTPKPGQKRVCVLAIGYGQTQGTSHKVAPLDSLCKVEGGLQNAPEWFCAGVAASQLAPTAMNQQKFIFTLHKPEPEGMEKVGAKPGLGFYTKVDLGIAKYHFEVAANAVSKNWQWE